VSHVANAAWEEWVTSIRTRALEQCTSYIERSASKWTKAGNSTFKCCSPLRSDKTPSFYVYANQGRWHDFGTGESGDLFTFVQLRDRCSWREALDTLAKDLGLPEWKTKRTGIGLAVDPDTLIEAWKLGEDERTLFECITAIVHLCHDFMPDRLRSFLIDHYQLSDEYISCEKIGFVPAGLWLLCKMRLPQYSEAILMKSGFFVQLPNSDPEPAQSQRILFPYWKDGLARYTIGRQHFFGVPLEEVHLEEWDRGKYKKHLTFNDKHPYVARLISNELLWNEDCIRHLRNDRVLFVAEGITDAMILAMLGMLVISPVTTSVSQKQIVRLLEFAKRAERVVICNDNDTNSRGEEPGKRGAIRTAKAMWDAGIRANIARLPRPEGTNKIDVNELLGTWIRGET
jgi:DNA primase